MCPSYCFMRESNCWLNWCFVFSEKSLVKCKMLDRFLPRRQILLPTNSHNNHQISKVMRTLKCCSRSLTVFSWAFQGLCELRCSWEWKSQVLTVFNKESNKNFGCDVCCTRLYLPLSRPGWRGFGSLVSVDPRRLQWEDRLGPHQTEITLSPRSSANKDIVTLEQQEGVKHKQLTRVLKPHHCMWLIYHNTDLFPFTGAERADQGQTQPVSMTLRITQYLKRLNSEKHL